MKPMTIGHAAKQAGVGVETIRFYEREGLIAQPPRRDGGYRQYSPETIKRIRFIKRAQDLGFSLKEASELLALRLGPETPAGEVKQRTEAKIAAIEHKIADLTRIKQVLVDLTDACHGCSPTRNCPILDALEHDAGEIR